MRHDEGGQVDYFHAALSKWAADRNPPFTVSRAATWTLMQEVGILNAAHESQPTGLVLAMHYCNAAVKFCRDLLNLFSAYSAIFSIDAKALYKCNKGISRSKGFQLISQRDMWGRLQHEAGADHLGKLSLFSVYKLPVTTSYIDATDGLRDATAEITGYDEVAFFRERPGLAAAFAHVEDHERETAARNIAASNASSRCSLALSPMRRATSARSSVSRRTTPTAPATRRLVSAAASSSSSSGSPSW